MTLLARWIARPLFRAIIKSSLSRTGQMPLPTDAPFVHAAGWDPDRILIIGTNAVIGFGVTSHDLGFSGKLARRISQLTGRGVDLVIAGSQTLTIEQAAALIGHHDLSRFDAVVIMLGAPDAVGFVNRATWRRRMGGLLETASMGPTVFALGVPDFTRNLDLPKFVTTAVRRQVGLLNDDLRWLARQLPGVQFVPFEPAHPAKVTPLGSTEMYDRWVDAVAPSLAAGLDPQAHALRAPEAIDMAVQQKSIDALDLDGESDDPQLQQFTQMARDLLGASGATVNFVVGNQSMSASGVSADHGVPMSDTFFSVTVKQHRLFVVEDALKDPRFAHHPWVVGTQHVRFYAGYPIEAPDGVAVGALSIIDTKARHFSDADHALLREAALQVQATLWSHTSSQPSGRAPVPAS